MDASPMFAGEVGIAPTQPGPVQEGPLPPEFWQVAILFVILFVLLVWKAFDEWDDDSTNKPFY